MERAIEAIVWRIFWQLLRIFWRPLLVIAVIYYLVIPLLVEFFHLAWSPQGLIAAALLLIWLRRR